MYHGQITTPRIFPNHLTIRNEFLQLIIDLSRFFFDITLEQAIEEVSKVVHLSYDVIRDIYKEQKRIKAQRKKM